MLQGHSSQLFSPNRKSPSREIVWIQGPNTKKDVAIISLKRTPCLFAVFAYSVT